MWILPLVAVYILGGLVACKKSGEGKGFMLKVTELPLRLGPLVRATTPKSSAFRVEVTNVSAAPIKSFNGAVAFFTEDGFSYLTPATYYRDSSSIPPGGKAEMEIPVTDVRIRSAKLIIKEVLYEAGILLNEPNGTLYGKWVNGKYEAELLAAKGYQPIGK